VGDRCYTQFVTGSSPQGGVEGAVQREQRSLRAAEFLQRILAGGAAKRRKIAEDSTISALADPARR
jgi:hypothetical protein